jgi:hypothetical protein
VNSTDTLPKQGGDGLKGDGRSGSIGRSAINDGQMGECMDAGGLAIGQREKSMDSNG